MKINISPMNDPTNSIRESYDRLAEEYTRRIADELQHKPSIANYSTASPNKPKDEAKYAT